MKRISLIGFLLFTSIGLSGCATYHQKVAKAKGALVNHDYDKALEVLKPLAEESSRDQLAYLLDYGTAQQIAGQYKDSSKSFILADRMADNLDYHSVSNIAASLATSQEMVQYKGDTFEKIFINAYLAMNFLQLGDYDSAAVEARRINEKYQKYRADEKKEYKLNPFSKYLSALVWEAVGRYDSAFIDYQDTYKIDSDFSNIGADLIRTAKLSGRTNDYNHYKKKFPHVAENPDWYNRQLGELVVIYQQGWGPVKTDPLSPYIIAGRVSVRNTFPRLAPVRSMTQRARVQIQDKKYLSSEVYNVEKAAIETLKDDQTVLVAKKVASVVAKAAIASAATNDNSTAQLLGLALSLTDRTDVRQWAFLPESIQVIRIPLKSGKYQIQVQGLDGSGLETGEVSPPKEVQIKSGKKHYLVWRSVK